MIKYPLLKELPATRQMVDTFRGYNHNLKIGAGEFYEMENMTSDDYPVLSVRGKRGLISSLKYGCSGMQYVPGKGLFYLENIGGNSTLCLMTPEGERTQIMLLNPNPKGLVLIGRRLVIFPDMYWVDIEGVDSGSLDEVWNVNSGTVRLQMCDAQGKVYENMTVSPEPPSAPYHRQLWLCNAEGNMALHQYEAVTAQWTTVTTYIKVSGLGKHQFNTYDAVQISGFTGAALSFNGSYIIEMVSPEDIVVTGLIQQSHTHDCQDGKITIERRAPKLDFVVEAGNRLWGCKRDTNEIYACKLGDIFNWNCFQGLSTDSWVTSIGTPGEFTGAVVQNGYPIFYKEDFKHKVWPSSTGAHQVVATPCDGVEKGSESSLAVLGDTVFYKSPFGICADDGGGPVEIGCCLGTVPYHRACGAVQCGKYYICMRDSDEKSHLFVYDISKKLWHRENGIFSDCITSGGGGVYIATNDALWDLTGKIGTPEEAVSWMVQTGELGLENPDQKYLSRLTLRMALEPGATMEIYAQYDREPVWVRLGQVYGTDLRSFSLPIRPRRCDQLRLKLQGKGMCKIYSLTKTIQKGSELP